MSDAARVRIESAGADGSVVVLVLEQPGRPVVVLDADLIRALDEALDRVAERTPAPRGLVLASASTRVFVAGADLFGIQNWDDDQLAQYLADASAVYARLAAFPGPTAAAINGAVLGGGLELAMHCDGLIACPGAKPYPVGLPEAGLGLCPGWGGTNLLPARMDPAHAIELTASGATLSFPNAVLAGLFDVVADDAAGLIDAAVKWVGEQPTPTRDGAPLRWIRRDPGPVRDALAALRAAETEPAQAVAKAVQAGLSEGWAESLRVEQSELVRLRHTQGAKDALAAFFDRSKAKS